MASCSNSLYALRVLRDHGIPANSLQDVYRATVLAKITYYACSWSGLCSANDLARLDAFLRRSKRYGYCAHDTRIISELFAAADQSLFERVLRNELHVGLLQPLLPEKMVSNRNLLPRQHDRQLIRKSAHINDSLFIIRNQNAEQRLLLTFIVTFIVSL